MSEKTLEELEEHASNLQLIRWFLLGMACISTWILQLVVLPVVLDNGGVFMLAALIVLPCLSMMYALMAGASFAYYSRRRDEIIQRRG